MHRCYEKLKERRVLMKDNKLIIYKNSEGNIIVDAIYKDETLWLSQKSMSKVFNVGIPAISKHLKNIFEDNELDRNSVISKMEITADDGKNYNTEVYNLDAIIAVGYRVNSKKATEFRIWATKILKEYMTKGFALNDERFINGNKYDNIIDMESGYYQWDNTGFENIPYEQRKGKKEKPKNKEWPTNYHHAVLEAQNKYDVVLTSMHWHLLDFFEENNIEYYLAYPTLDSEKVLEERCYARGNNNIFTDKLKINLYNWNEIIKDYHPKKLLIIQKNEYLEDVLKNNRIIN